MQGFLRNLTRFGCRRRVVALLECTVIAGIIAITMASGLASLADALPHQPGVGQPQL